jgi:hypothetical protein
MGTTSQRTDLRISAAEARRRVQSGEPATILDVRGPAAFDGSNVKVRGAIRAAPADFHVDPAWPKDRLTVVY